MDPSRHDRVSEILADALELAPAERGPYLDRACSGIPGLREEVESLLVHDGDAASILDRDVSPRPLARLPERIGRYHVLEKLGEGGMGVVYRAEQRLPIERQVAVKRVRAGFETEQAVARFESECRNVARMEHPYIARVIEAGSTEDGLPYFAMEYVAGESLVKHSDRRRLSIDARIALFLEVCEGVQHAHRHGIIHRDLKPSNILVTEVDGRPTPKIIDFGVAKALDVGPDREAVTAAGQLLGTPEYMSPEQAAGSAEIDTRADVYALGAVLYELLVGRRPQATDQGELERPSMRLATLGPTATEVAHDRSCTPKQLTLRIRGDLDWIVMKALEHERDRRYDSVTDLARDLKRHLVHEPVTARPPTLAYRTRKLVRRHRTTAALIAILAPVALVFTALLVAQRSRTAVERDRFEGMARFLIHLFDNPSETVTGRWITQTPQAILVGGMRKVETELDDPLVQARTYAAIGRTLRSLDVRDHAETATTRARDRFVRLLGTEHPETLVAQTELARVLAWGSRLDEADQLLVETLAAQRRVRGDQHAETIDSILELAQVRNLEGKHEESAVLFDEAARALSATVGPDHPRTLVAQSLLGSVYGAMGRLDEADRILSAVVSQDALPRSEHGPALYNLACARALRGDRDGAIASLREAFETYGFGFPIDAAPSLVSLFDDPEFIELAKRVRAKDPQLWESRWRDATHLAGERRYEEAETHILALIRDAPSDGHTENAAWDLATAVYLPLGRYAEAEKFMEMSVDLERRAGRTSWISQSGLAIARFGKGDRVGAKAAVDEAVRLSDEGPDSPPGPVPFLMRAYRSAMDGDDEDALRNLRQAYERGLTGIGPVEDKLFFGGLHGNLEFERLRRRMEERAQYP